MKKQNIFICFLMVVLMTFANVTGSFAEGLSDAQLYGNDAENVLGNKATVPKNKQKKETQKTEGTIRDDIKKNDVSFDADVVSQDAIEHTQHPENSQVVVSSFEATVNDETIDAGARMTEPCQEISIEGAENDKNYAEGRFLKVVISNLHRDASANAVLLYTPKEGQLLTKQVELSVDANYTIGEVEAYEEGSYHLNVNVIPKDVAQKMQEEIAFVVDKTPPVIDFTKMATESCSKIDVAQLKQEIVQDEHLKTVRVVINGQETDQAIIEEPGAYQVEVYAQDEAGNHNAAKEELYVQDTHDSTTTNGKKRSSQMMTSGCGALCMIGGILLFREQKRKKQMEEKGDKHE